MSKKISIVTINYNNLKGLKRTIESVVNQTWKEFEYIVIDGGSTDGSDSYIESQSANINYWVSEPDKGIFNAMNKGIAKASGEYLLFLNSGDHLFSDEVLKENISYLEYYDLIYFNVQFKGNDTSYFFSCPNTLRFSDLYFDTLPHPSTFIKKELFEKIGLYDEDLKIVSDWKFFILALFTHHCSYKKINETLSTFYLGGISSLPDNSYERNQVLQEFFLEFFLDYAELDKIRNELQINTKILESNRFKMLSQIEKSLIGRKIVSLFFRIYIVLFSKSKLKDTLKKDKKK